MLQRRVKAHRSIIIQSTFSKDYALQASRILPLAFLQGFMSILRDWHPTSDKTLVSIVISKFPGGWQASLFWKSMCLLLVTSFSISWHQLVCHLAVNFLCWLTRCHACMNPELMCGMLHAVQWGHQKVTCMYVSCSCFVIAGITQFYIAASPTTHPLLEWWAFQLVPHGSTRVGAYIWWYCKACF